MMTEKKKLTLKGRSKKTESDSEAKKSTLSLKRRRKQVIVVDKKADQPEASAEAQFAPEAKAPPRPTGQRRKRKVVVNSNARRNKPRKPKAGGGHKISVAKKKQAAPKPKPQPQKKKLPQKDLPKVKVHVVREPTPSQLSAKELNERLMEEYSVWRDFKPLQLGVDEVVYNWIQTNDWSYSKRVIQKAFRLHTRDARYRKAVAAGGMRYGLDGEPHGEVDDVAKTYARLKEQRCNMRTKYDEVEQSLYAEAGHVA